MVSLFHILLISKDLAHILITKTMLFIYIWLEAIFVLSCTKPIELEKWKGKVLIGSVLLYSYIWTSLWI